MVKTFITSVKLENTCKVNKMINSLKKFTRIGSDISSDLYSNKGIKVIAGVLSVIKTVIELFGSKILAIFIANSSISSLNKFIIPFVIKRI